MTRESARSPAPPTSKSLSSSATQPRHSARRKGLVRCTEQWSSDERNLEDGRWTEEWESARREVAIQTALIICYTSEAYSLPVRQLNALRRG